MPGQLQQDIQKCSCSTATGTSNVSAASCVKEAAAPAHAASTKMKQKSTSAAVWLLQNAACGMFKLSSLTAPATAAHFLTTSNIPAEVASAFLQAGLDFSYEQLMQSVRARTAGVAELPMPESSQRASLPPWVFEVCRNKTVSKFWDWCLTGRKLGSCSCIKPCECLTQALNSTNSGCITCSGLFWCHP